MNVKLRTFNRACFTVPTAAVCSKQMTLNSKNSSDEIIEYLINVFAGTPFNLFSD